MQWNRRTLSLKEKADYFTAVKCILKKPALTPPFENSGVLSRYDDLVYTHIQQTFSIHYVGHFLPWHRYFVATYEHMLRDECGYKGAQPYWDWTLDVNPPNSNISVDEYFARSPVFDADTGFGGNGQFVPVNESNPFEVPGRTGGGCVQDGPFAGDSQLVHLGPTSSVTYNPQCLKRDFSAGFARRYLGLNQTQLTLSQPNYGWFDSVVEGGPSFDASGVHGGGHYGVGGTYGKAHL
jgi:tyrosinase